MEQATDVRVVDRQVVDRQVGDLPSGGVRSDRSRVGDPLLGEVVGVLRGWVDRVQGPAYGVSTAELMADVGVLQAILAVAGAAQTVRIAQFAAREEQVDDDGVVLTGDRGVGHVSEFAADELAPVLGAAPGTAARRAQVAAKLTADLPVTMRALSDAELDAFRAQVVAEELDLADADVCAVVEGMIYPAATGDTPGRLRSRVRRALREVDPLAVREAAAKARADRFVRVREGALPGVSEWWASMPTEDSLACWAAIQDVAHRMKAEDHTRSLDACRLDALVDLILGRVEVATTITLAVPVHTAAHAAGQAASAAHASGAHAAQQPGQDEDAESSGPAAGPAGDAVSAAAAGPAGDAVSAAAAGPARGSASFAPTGPADTDTDTNTNTNTNTHQGRPDQRRPDQGCPGRGYEMFKIRGGLSFATGCQVPGMGYIPGDVVADLLARFDTQVSRMLIDAATGVTIETTSSCYRPPEAMRRYVRARDGTCRFPGCGAAARRCDLDHVVPAPGGPTTPANLICLCRHHHRVKTHTRWRAELAPDGNVTWTDPYGQHWLTRPLDHLATHIT